MTDTSGAPWLKYQAGGSPPADATPGPWSKYQTDKSPISPPQEKSVSTPDRGFVQDLRDFAGRAEDFSDIPKRYSGPTTALPEAIGRKVAGAGARGVASFVQGAEDLADVATQKTDSHTQSMNAEIMKGKVPGDINSAIAIGATPFNPKGALSPSVGRILSDQAPIPSQMTRDIIKPPAPELPPTVTSADDMKKVAAHYYRQAEAQGGTLSPAYTDSIIDKIEKPLVRPDKIGKIAGEDDATMLAKGIREHAGGKPLTLEEAQALDEHMGDLVDKHFTVKGLDKVGKRIVDMQSGLRESIGGAGESDLVGGPGGFQALKDGRQAWAQAAKMRDIEAITEGAQYADQPTTWVRNRVRTILTNKAKRRGFSEAEIAELEKVAKTGKVEGLLKAFGGRLTPYMAEAVGGSIGGIPGFVAGAGLGHAGSTLARNAAGGLQGRKVTNLMELLGQGAPSDAGSILKQLGQSDAP